MASLYKIDKVTSNRAAFETKVRTIASSLGIEPDWLMAVMDFESGLSTTAKNKYTNATGLIQFMPSTAKSLGTTVEALAAMTNLQQLDYVFKYLSPYKGRMKSLTDVYLTVFYPAAVGKPDSFVFSDKVKEQNPVFNKYLVDNKLTKGSIVNYISDRFKDLVKKATIGLGVIILLATVGLMIANRM